jgi:hypothetical protein
MMHFGRTGSFTLPCGGIDRRELISLHECHDIQQGADMTPHLPENVVSTWLVTNIGNTMPPREPNDDEEDDDEDEDDENEPDEPAVVREPDDE